ncbi:MAG TPA: MFS transporter [Phenylobacterium sp.]|uniref:MFS transporter n=1 Tax=Phenylobacterium sp. TaxID=1871053 RepID=UPI002B4A8536|nr:MFS transporter [Phenylobacterium sp.]HKR90252.1 MFS transporter [Phenylobacterium sp.]
MANVAARAAPQELSSAYPRSSLAWYVAGVLAVAFWVAYLDRMVITLLTPALKADLHLSDTGVSFLQGPAFSLCFAVAGLPIGRLVDRANRRNILVVGILTWSVATLCSGLASSYWQLFSARMGLGIAEACLSPAAYSMLADLFAPRARGRASGVLMGAIALGTASSQMLTGALLKALHGTTTVSAPILGDIAAWRLAFIVFSVPGFLATLLAMTLKEPARRELAASQPSSFLPHLKRHSGLYIPLFASYALNQLFIFAYLYWGPLVFVRTYRLSVADAGILSGAMLVISGLIGGVTGGFLSDALVARHPSEGRLRIVCAIIPMQIAAAAVFAFGGSLPVAIAGFTIIKILSPLISGVTNVIMQDLWPDHMRGQAVALLALMSSAVGSTLGPIAPAVFTDYLFRDEKMLGPALLIVGMLSLGASLALGLAALVALRRSRGLAQP